MPRARVQDQPTRGKTAPNRLRRLDIWVQHAHASLIRRPPGGLFLDLGYGRVPRTTLETARRLRRLDPELEVLGVERDPERVAAAAEAQGPRTRFVAGGFDVQPGRPVRLLRAMNVLRQYPPEDVHAARVAMGRLLEEGGLLLEGTCDPFGRLHAVHTFRREGQNLVHSGLLFAARVDADFHPAELQTVLPKDLMDRVVPGEPVHRFFSAWRRGWETAAPWRELGPRAVWREAQAHLARTEPIDPDPWLLRHGYVLWRPERDGVPLPRFA